LGDIEPRKRSGATATSWRRRRADLSSSALAEEC
jgi:hypothetical protein